MTEAVLKGQLAVVIRDEHRKAIVFRIEDRFTHGIPDFIIPTPRPSTLYIEVKYMNPYYRGKGIQELTMNRLALQGHPAFYVIYYERDDVKRTYIVDPRDIGKGVDEWNDYHEGFAHKWVSARLKDL
jgi:hypothetical protein